MTPALALLVCALVAVGPPLAAAQAPDDPEEGLRLSAELGLGETFKNGRWAPVTIWTEAHAPMSGRVEVSYGLDPTQSIRISCDFSATPGQRVPVRLIAPTPVSYLDRVRIDAVARDTAGRRWTSDLTLSAFGDRDRALPQPVDEQTVLIGVIGASSGARALEAIMGVGAGVGRARLPEDELAEQQSIAGLRRLVDVDRRMISHLRRGVWLSLEPQRLPEADLGYDAAAVIILRADAAAEMTAAQIDALRSWTRAGGRLVLLASAPGDYWRNWLAGEPLPISVAGAAQVDLPEELAALARRAGEPAPQAIAAREISITGAGQAGAWQLLWPTGGAAGLGARGPFGLGWLTVVGVEPGGAIGDARSDLATGMWLQALVDPLHEQLRDAIGSEAPYDSRWPWSGGQRTGEQAAMVDLLDAMAIAAPAGAGAFIVIALAAGALALLVGPVDYILLGRLRARGRWWLTSLGWVAIASALAWWGPRLIRTEPTSVRRHETIDVRLRADGPAQVWSTGLTALFAAQGAVVTFSGQAPGSWWQGVSPLASEYWGSAPATVATPVHITPPGPASPGQGLLAPAPVRMWTLRTFMDHAQGERSIAASVEPGPGLVQVGGLSAEERIEEIALRIGDRVWSSNLGAGAPEPEISGRAQIVRWRPGGSPLSARSGLTGSLLAPARQAEAPVPAAPFLLDGARQRTRTIDRLLDGGSFAVIYLQTSVTEPVIEINLDSEYQTRRIYRIVVPIGGSQQ